MGPLDRDADRPRRDAGESAVQARYVPAEEPAAEHPASSLRSVLVEYPDRPDRRTICPRDIDRAELMVTWVTADADAFVDLRAAR